MKEQIINRFIGVIDNRDEYQKQEIFKELAFSGIILYFFTIILMVGSFVIDTINNEISLITPALIILNIAYAGFITMRLNKKQLDVTDCVTPEEYELKKSKLKKSSTFAGLQWGLSMLLLMEYIFPLIGREKITFSWIQVIPWCLGGVAFGVCIYAFSNSKLRKHYEEIE